MRESLPKGAQGGPLPPRMSKCSVAVNSGGEGGGMRVCKLKL